MPVRCRQDGNNRRGAPQPEIPRFKTIQETTSEQTSCEVLSTLQKDVNEEV